MHHERAAGRILGVFMALPLAGFAAFIAAQTIGIKAAVIAGEAGLAAFGVLLFAAVFKGGLFAGFPRSGIIAFGVACAWMFWISSLPPYFRDDLITHLALPALYLLKGKWLFPAFQPSAFSPDLMLPLNMAFISAGADRAASLLTAAYIAGAALFLAHWTAMESGPRWGMAAGAALLSLSVLFRLSTTTYTDPAVMFFSGAGLFYLRLFTLRPGFKNACLGAAAFAAASAIKYNGALLMLCVLAPLFPVFFSEGRLREWLKAAAVAALLTALLCGPWWAAVKLSGAHPNANPMADMKNPVRERTMTCGESPAWAAAAPLRLFFTGNEGDRCGFDGALNPFIVILAAGGIAAAGARAADKALFAAALLFILLSGFFISPMARYYLPLAPALIFLSVSFLVGLAARKNRWPAYALAALLLVFNVKDYAAAAARFEGWELLAGRVSKEEFLAKNIPGHRAVIWANGHLPPSSRIYFVFAGNRVYYSNVDYFYDTFWDGTSLMTVFTRKKAPPLITEAFSKMGITHLLIMKGLMQRFVEQNGLRETFTRFVAESAVVYEDGESALIALKAGEAR